MISRTTPRSPTRAELAELLARTTADDLWTAAATVWGEARGEPQHGRIAVACVLRNRAARGYRGDRTLGAVARSPKQFSCWDSGDPNRAQCGALTLEDAVFRDCFIAVLQALPTGASEFAAVDATFGSLHYCALRSAPAWARGHDPCAIIGRHKFFNDVA
jgi:spore germination cell wall hydrolase CwlJ-like protein